MSGFDDLEEKIEKLKKRLSESVPDEGVLIDDIHDHLVDQISVHGMKDGGDSGVWPPNDPHLPNDYGTTWWGSTNKWARQYARRKHAKYGQLTPMVASGALERSIGQKNWEKKASRSKVSYTYWWQRPSDRASGFDVAAYYQHADKDTKAESRRFIMTEDFKKKVLEHQMQAFKGLIQSL